MNWICFLLIFEWQCRIRSIKIRSIFFSYCIQRLYGWKNKSAYLLAVMAFLFIVIIQHVRKNPFSGSTLASLKLIFLFEKKKDLCLRRPCKSFLTSGKSFPGSQIWFVGKTFQCNSKKKKKSDDM